MKFNDGRFAMHRSAAYNERCSGLEAWNKSQKKAKIRWHVYVNVVLLLYNAIKCLWHKPKYSWCWPQNINAVSASDIIYTWCSDEKRRMIYFGWRHRRNYELLADDTRFRYLWSGKHDSEAKPLLALFGEIIFILLTWAFTSAPGLYWHVIWYKHERAEIWEGLAFCEYSVIDSGHSNRNNICQAKLIMPSRLASAHFASTWHIAWAIKSLFGGGIIAIFTIRRLLQRCK